MTTIIEIGQASNPLLTFAPILLMIFSGYAGGRIISSIRGKVTGGFLGDLIYGNIILNFLFLAGFIIFGVVVSAANEYFAVFTYILVGLSVLGVYFLLKLIITILKSGGDGESTNIKIRRIKSLFFVSDNQTTIFILFGIALFVTLLVYQATIIYYHPIYSEYDSIYRFLPISKSILLGNSLNHDFYLGSDINMRYPPFIQALNAWLIHSFEYSSIRMFPFYYVLFAAILVYSLTRNVLIKTSSNGESSFFGLIASSAFLITPALLVVSSRFSLQQDLGFIFMLTASFYFLSDIVRNNKPAKTTLLMLSTSLALMALTREIALVIAVAIFFLVPAIKYTEGNLKLRALFTILSFLPLYLYYFVFYGAVEITSGLLLIISNIAVFFIVSQLKNQNKFSSLIRPVTNITYIVPLVIPAIFILTNVIMFNGVYPGIVYSDRYYDIVDIDVGIFATQSDKHQEISDMIMGIPRIDILFISVAMGSVIIFFKLVGFGRLIRHLKNNYEYSLILVLLIFLLVTWAFLLQSDFQTSDIRYVAYFVPILSVILVIGMKIGKESSYYWKIYCYLVIVFITFYFITYNLHFLIYNGNFSGFAIDPFKNSIMSAIDFGIGIILLVPLITVRLKEFKLTTEIKKKIVLQRLSNAFIIASLAALLAAQIFIIYSNRVNVSPLGEIDQVSPPGWETNVIEVIDYLNIAENGNVLAVRAPAIPFFTNRTSFDLFNPDAFAYNISDLLSSKNATLFKSGLSDRDIRYIIVPNERSSLYYSVQNLTKTYPLLQVINTDRHFEKLIFRDYSVYKYSPVLEDRIDLIDKNHVWKSFGQAEITQNADNLTIRVNTDEKDILYNRGFLQTELNLTKPLLLSLDYKVETNVGNATYAIEIRESNSSKILFNSFLDNVSGNATDKTFILPTNINVDEPLEFRVYVITQGTGYHALIINKLSILHT